MCECRLICRFKNLLITSKTVCQSEFMRMCPKEYKGAPADLSCSDGKTISILNSKIGTHELIEGCNEAYDTKCMVDLTTSLSNLCNGKDSCRVSTEGKDYIGVANNFYCSGVLPHIYLEVDWVCQ
eukprot:sb/3475632/